MADALVHTLALQVVAGPDGPLAPADALAGVDCPDAPELTGTAGAVRGALEHLGDEFLVLYGDTYLRIDYRAVQAARRASGRVGGQCVHPTAQRRGDVGIPAATANQSA